MAKLYVPSDVPAEFCYLGNFTNTYFDLYNSANPVGSNVPYYRIYYNYDDNFYLQSFTNFPNYANNNYPYVETTNSIYNSISNFKYFIVAFVVIFFLVFVCNVVTSIFKRGGIFSA